MKDAAKAPGAAVGVPPAPAGDRPRGWWLALTWLARRRPRGFRRGRRKLWLYADVGDGGRALRALRLRLHHRQIPPLQPARRKRVVWLQARAPVDAVVCRRRRPRVRPHLRLVSWCAAWASPAKGCWGSGRRLAWSALWVTLAAIFVYRGLYRRLEVVFFLFLCDAERFDYRRCGVGAALTRPRRRAGCCCSTFPNSRGATARCSS